MDRLKTLATPARLTVVCGFVVLAAGAVGAVLYFFDPAQHGFYPTCQFHRLTGLDCPGCGSLRALHQLAHGHLAAAFHFNPLLILSMPLLAAVLSRTIARKFSGHAVPVSVRPIYLWLLLVVLIAFGVLRNLPPFNAFAP